MEALSYSVRSVVARVTRRNIPDDGILQEFSLFGIAQTGSADDPSACPMAAWCFHPTVKLLEHEAAHWASARI
jgi:hypothetical protein